MRTRYYVGIGLAAALLSASATIVVWQAGIGLGICGMLSCALAGIEDIEKREATCPK